MKKFKKMYLFCSTSLVPMIIFSVTSCSIKEENYNNFIDYDGTRESFDNLVKNISHKDFQTNFNLKINEVKSSDIIWRYKNEYEKLNIRMDIIIVNRGKLEFPPNSGDYKENAIEFTFVLQDIDKKWFYDGSGRRFWLWSYK